MALVAGLQAIAMANSETPGGSVSAVTDVSVKESAGFLELTLTADAPVQAHCTEDIATHSVILSIGAVYKASALTPFISDEDRWQLEAGQSTLMPAISQVRLSSTQPETISYSLAGQGTRVIKLTAWTDPRGDLRSRATTPLDTLLLETPPTKGAVTQKVLGSVEQIGNADVSVSEPPLLNLAAKRLAGEALSNQNYASPNESATPDLTQPAHSTAQARPHPQSPIARAPSRKEAASSVQARAPVKALASLEARASHSETPELDVYDTDIGVVARTLASQWGENIVVAQDAKAQITARLSGSNLEEILSQITASNGLDLKRENGAFVISKVEPPQVDHEANQAASDKDSDLAIWRCRYNNATELVATLTKLFPSLNIASGPTYTSPLLDASAASVDGAQLATASDTQSSANSLQPGTVIMRGPRTALKEAMELLRQLDVRRSQVVIEALVTEISDEASRQLGLSWSWNSLQIKETPDAHMRFGRFTRNGLNFEGILEAMNKEGQAKLLARPSLAVVDGAHGSILIGDRIIYPKVIGYSSLNTPIYDKEEEKVGIYLQVAPMITEDGYITMTVYPQVSVVKGFLNIQGSQYPQISTREAKTTVRLKEGEQFAIGGLIRDDEINTLIKVPLLGDLPIIKSLFRHREKTRNRSEIVIFLTPKIIKGEQIDHGAVLTNAEAIPDKEG